jgi:tetratricopeptide (TPR) repeat protein
MATLADVKETLESKRDLLQEVYAESRLLDGAARDEKIALARKHYDYAADVFRLSEGFLKASATRHPKYATFWSRYEKTLGGLWQEIRDVQGKIIEGPETPPAQVAAAVPASAPAPVEAAVPAPEAVPSDSGLGRAVPAVVARVEKAGDAKQHVLERYREGYQAFARGGEADLETSRGIFEEILQVQPGFHLARYWLARTYLLQDRVEAAGKEAERLLKEQPNLQIAKDLVRDVADIRNLRQVARSPQVAPAAPVAAPAPTAKPVEAPRVRTPKAPAPQVAAHPAPVAPAPVAAVAARAPAKPALPKAAHAKAAPGELRIAKVPPITVPPASAAGRPRPIAVMVENSRHARPQSGLLQADVVFEAPVEGGITRFLAVFQDPQREVQELGPVRSARHYFVHQVPAMDAIYAHCGGSTLGYAAIKKDKVDHIDESGGASSAGLRTTSTPSWRTSPASRRTRASA